MVSQEDLAAIPFFAQLSEAERKILASITNKKDFLKDETIFIESSPCRTLFIVQDGEVKITRLVREHEELLLATLKCGDFFGGMSFIDGQKHSATAVCADDLVVLTIDKDDFDEFTRKNPLLGIKILKCIGIEICLYLRIMTYKFHNLVDYVISQDN